MTPHRGLLSEHNAACQDVCAWVVGNENGWKYAALLNPFSATVSQITVISTASQTVIILLSADRCRQTEETLQQTRVEP